MADDSIVFHAEIDKGGEGAKSLSQLKKEFKEVQKELDGAVKGTEQYRNALSKLANVKDEIEDLNDEIKGFQGAGKFQAFSNVASSLAGGFQAATGAAALFGVESEEVSKALLKIQAAMALTDGIKAIEGMGQSLTVVGNIIRTNVVTAFSTLKGAIMATGIGALVVAIGALIYYTNEYNEAIEEEYDKQRKLNEELKKTTDEYLKQAAASEKLRDARKGGLNELERELKLLEASGASADLIAQKKQDILDKEIFNLKVRRSTIEGDAAMESELTQQILDKENEKQALVLANERRKRDEAIKSAQERMDLEDKLFKEAFEKGEALDKAEADRSQWEREGRIFEEQEADRLFKKLTAQREESEKQERDQAERNEAFMDGYRKRENARLDEKIAKEKEVAQAVANAKLAIENQSFTAARAVSDAFFTGQLNRAQGNAAKELEIRKKQFQVEKAFNIARATIDGFRAVTSALHAAPPPFNFALAALNGIAAAATIAKLAATKFDGGGVSTGSFSAPSGGTAPQIQTQAPNISPETRLSEDGRNMNVQVELVETQATSTQNRVKRLQNQSKFG